MRERISQTPSCLLLQLKGILKEMISNILSALIFFHLFSGTDQEKCQQGKKSRNVCLNISKRTELYALCCGFSQKFNPPFFCLFVCFFLI